MKTHHIFLSFLFILGIQFMGMAQKPSLPWSLTNESLKVWGNCEMCKKRIEKAAIGAGANSANWNVDTKILTVSYNVKTSSSDKIQSAIAAIGHDTRDYYAGEEAYNHLPSCCQYERKATTASAPMNHKDRMDCCSKHQASAICDDCRNCEGVCCPDGKGGSTCSTNCNREQSSAVAGKSNSASSCCNGKTCMKS